MPLHFVKQGPIRRGPGFALPPVTGGAPGSGFPEHIPLKIFFLRAGNAHGLRVFPRSHGRAAAGRKRRRAVTADFSSSGPGIFSRSSFREVWAMKRRMRNPSGRCVSSNSTAPTLFSPTMLAMRARVSSSFFRFPARVAGTGRPGGTRMCRCGSQMDLHVGAPGGCAFKSSCSNLRKTLGRA